VVDVQTLLETFLNFFIRSACVIDEAFYGKKSKLLVMGLLPCSANLPGCQDYQMTN
jgi:hypothetical protein